MCVPAKRWIGAGRWLYTRQNKNNSRWRLLKRAADQKANKTTFQRCDVTSSEGGDRESMVTQQTNCNFICGPLARGRLGLPQDSL